MTGTGRLFRISGSSRVMTLYGEAVAKLAPYLAYRSLPWVVDGQPVRHWLTRAELLALSNGTSRSGADDAVLCKLLKGGNALVSQAPDDRHTWQSISGYVDLPAKGANQNPFRSLCRPYGWADVVVTSPTTLSDRLLMLIGKVNNEPLLPPDDPASKGPALNDKRNLRGLQYLAYLVWRDEPLVLPGSGTVAPISKAEKARCADLFHGRAVPRYGDIAKAVATIMTAAGIADY
ncbi:MAG: hypothetical protein PHS60_06105 [Zavarzinia sp.]|nr:hypothetical protein [Zavarzinia sp.]